MPVKYYLHCDLLAACVILIYFILLWMQPFLCTLCLTYPCSFLDKIKCFYIYTHFSLSNVGFIF